MEAIDAVVCNIISEIFYCTVLSFNDCQFDNIFCLMHTKNFLWKLKLVASKMSEILHYINIKQTSRKSKDLINRISLYMYNLPWHGEEYNNVQPTNSN